MFERARSCASRVPLSDSMVAAPSDDAEGLIRHSDRGKESFFLRAKG
jgi:hypothetical protein